MNTISTQQIHNVLRTYHKVLKQRLEAPGASRGQASADKVTLSSEGRQLLVSTAESEKPSAENRQSSGGDESESSQKSR